MDGDGPELTLPEAAVLLGTSVASVRRRIKAGQIDAYHDARGRVRIRASLAGAAEQQSAPGLADIWNELKATKHDLAAASAAAADLRQELGIAHYHRREAQQARQSLQQETERLQEGLEAARQEAEDTKQELAAMWRVMSSRKQRAEAAGRFAGMTDGNEAFDLPPSRRNLEMERSRIKDQLDRVRELSRRRRWPWLQAS